MRRIGWGLVCFYIGWTVQAVGAQAATFTISDPTMSPTQTQTVFTLDQGFVGRAVKLEVDNGKIGIQWKAGDLLNANKLTVELEKIATSSVDGFDLADRAIQLNWDDMLLVSSQGPFLSFTGCVPDTFTECALFQQRGDDWKRIEGWHVTSSSPVRLGVKRWAYMREGMASWYAYKRCLCAASPDFPKGTRLRVRSVQDPQKSVVVTVNDFGPERKRFPERAIDLDAVAFKKIAKRGAGVLKVTIEPLVSTDPEYRVGVVKEVKTTTVAGWAY